MSTFLLTTIIFLPFVGGLLGILIKKSGEASLKYLALGTTFLNFILSVWLVSKFDPALSTVQFVEKYKWIQSINIFYEIGVDGLTIYLIPLTTLIFFLCVLASWSMSFGSRGFFGLLLMLESCVLGTFLAQDLFLFFCFWEASILPVYFMTGVWGSEGRVVAATKFFLYQIIGSVFLFLGMLTAFYISESQSFSISDMSKIAFENRQILFFGYSFNVGLVVYCLMFVGFLIRLGGIPLHSWLVSILEEAPIVVSVVVASVFIKTGAYGLFRLSFSLFPQASVQVSEVLAILGAVNIIYGGLCALGQSDLRRLVAFMCVGHMGFVLFGMGTISSNAFQGALFQLVSHGVYTALLIFLVGLLGERLGGFQIVSKKTGESLVGGLTMKLPVLSGIFTLGIFAAMGLPGFAAFPAEALVFLGTFQTQKVLTLIALFGLVLIASYFLWMFRRVFLGPVSGVKASVIDLTAWEQLYLFPLIVLSVLIGVYPSPFIKFSAETLGKILSVLIGVK